MVVVSKSDRTRDTGTWVLAFSFWDCEGKSQSLWVVRFHIILPLLVNEREIINYESSSSIGLVLCALYLYVILKLFPKTICLLGDIDWLKKDWCGYLRGLNCSAIKITPSFRGVLKACILAEIPHSRNWGDKSNFLSVHWQGWCVHETKFSQVLPPGALEYCSLSDQGRRGNSTSTKLSSLTSIQWGYLFWVELCLSCVHPNSYVVVKLLSRVQLFATPWTATCQAFLSFTISQSFLKLMSIESVMPSNQILFFFFFWFFLKILFYF